jgi:hypothetical protein
MDAFYQWVRLRIPDDCIIQMPQLVPTLTDLVFASLDVSG